MKLFEHPDFEQAVIRAAEHFRPRGLREAIIEKDYYVTEALRIIEREAGARVIFKGGTSLSKGWNLIQRFSEDIDIFLDPTAFDPPLGKKGIDRELKKLRQAIERHPGLKFVDKESQTIGGFGRNDRFEYVQRFAWAGEIRNRVFVEAGTASGREPTERVRMQSYVGQFLQETGVSLGAEDEGPFEMRLLHFRRTFVEKMFAIRAKVEAFKKAGKEIGGYARHYYDLFCLAERPEVLAMLQAEEYEIIKADYDQISREHFDKSYVAPPDMSFANSDALFQSQPLADQQAIRHRMATRRAGNPQAVITQGRFLEYAPPRVILDFFEANPELFLDMHCWEDAYGELDYGHAFANQEAHGLPHDWWTPS